MKSIRLPLLALSLFGLSFATAPAPVALDFEALAQQKLKQRGMQDATPDTFTFEDYCNRDFVHLEVGLFDLYMDRAAFAEKTDAKRMFAVGSSLASMQVDWLDWTDPGGAQYGEEAKIAADLAKYLKTASPGSIGIGGPITGEGGDGAPEAIDLWTRLKIKDTRLAGFRKFAQFMQTNGGLGLEREALREPIVLYPDRGEYVELIALAGWARPEARDRMWHPSVYSWTNFYVNQWRFVSMAYGPANPTDSTYRNGMPMEARTPTGLQQQICQLGALGMLDNYFGGRIPPLVAGGLSVNLVVAQFGECNTRVDGDLRERRKDARAVFVPGGLSEGGVLPPNLADSRWREFHGKHHFLKKLAESQKEGAEAVKRSERKDKVRYFELIADDEVKKDVTEAPMLGSNAAGLGGLGQEFFGDRLEFARSYSSGFLYWLREKGGGRKSAESKSKFAGLLKTFAHAEAPDTGGILANEDNGPSFEEIFAGHYDKPLSEPQLKPKESLEGAFLHWLPKGK